MPVNSAGRRAILSCWNSDGRILLLTLTHALITTERLALTKNNVSSTVEGGGAQTFTAFPFIVDLPTDDKGAPRGSIRVSNVTRRVWDLIGALETPPQLNFYFVLESDVNTAQESFLLLDVHRVAAKGNVIEGVFGHENYAIEPYPAARVVGEYCPWMLYVG